MADLGISAALIVRNEARVLGDCLASLEGLVDEVVVVDTGSSDITRAIAVARGARVVDFAWCDDFAAARNRALDLARGAWILYIDADERARCSDKAALEQLLRTPRLIALQVLFHVHPGYTPYQEVRLFRNDPRIRFRGVIHESIWPAIREQVSEGGGGVGTSPVELLHVGYLGDLGPKAQRNLPLLERAATADPQRIYLWCELGKAYDLVGRQIDAARAFRKALTVARTRASLDPEDSVAYTDVIRWRFAQSRRVDSLIAEGLRHFPGNRQLLWSHACRLMERRNFRRAATVLERVLDSRPGSLDLAISYDKRILGVFGLDAMATCCFKLGRYADAATYFGRALAEEPGNVELQGKTAMAERLARLPPFLPPGKTPT